MSLMPEILFQDDDFIILNKPANLLSVPGRGPDKQDCLSSRVQSQFENALVVHRLDYDTSGIMLMALGKKAQSEASKLFQQRAIEKHYQAVVFGCPKQASGEMNQPMRCDWENRPLQIIDPEQGKSALTYWKKLETLENGNCRLLLTPHTGRSHQLRLHMKTLGHPILGDNLYGCESSFNASPRLLLHATQLSFRHPFSHQQCLIESQPPF